MSNYSTFADRFHRGRIYELPPETIAEILRKRLLLPNDAWVSCAEWAFDRDILRLRILSSTFDIVPEGACFPTVSELQVQSCDSLIVQEPYEMTAFEELVWTEVAGS